MTNSKLFNLTIMAKKVFVVDCITTQANSQASGAQFAKPVDPKVKGAKPGQPAAPGRPRTTITLGVAPEDGSAHDFVPGKSYKITIEEA